MWEKESEHLAGVTARNEELAKTAELPGWAYPAIGAGLGAGGGALSRVLATDDEDQSQRKRNIMISALLGAGLGGGLGAGWQQLKKLESVPPVLKDYEKTLHPTPEPTWLMSKLLGLGHKATDVVPPRHLISAGAIINAIRPWRAAAVQRRRLLNELVRSFRSPTAIPPAPGLSATIRRLLDKYRIFPDTGIGRPSTARIQETVQQVRKTLGKPDIDLEKVLSRELRKTPSAIALIRRWMRYPVRGNRPATSRRAPETYLRARNIATAGGRARLAAEKAIGGKAVSYDVARRVFGPRGPATKMENMGRFAPLVLIPLLESANIAHAVKRMADYGKEGYKGAVERIKDQSK